jgi:hypothetical protein
MVRYGIMTALLCYGHHALSKNELLQVMIEQDQSWLAEQLEQLSYPELNKLSVYELVHYFSYKTDDYFNDLVNEGRDIPRDFLQMEMSIAMHKIVNAAVHTHAHPKINPNKIRFTNVSDHIIEKLVTLYGGSLYQNNKISD